MSREVMTGVVAGVIGSKGSVDPAKVQAFMKQPKLQFTIDCLVEEYLADVVFVVDGQCFPAHRGVLAAQSQYFRERFKSDQADAQSILLWNLGPHGFDKSGLHIDHILAEKRTVICLQDLRIPLRRKEEIRCDLERRSPYKVFICALQHRKTSRHPNSGYVFSTLTALHTGVFLCASSFHLGAPEHRTRRGRRRMVFTDAGRSLCSITATRHFGEKIHFLNIYQFTAAHSHAIKVMGTTDGLDPKTS